MAATAAKYCFSGPTHSCRLLAGIQLRPRPRESTQPTACANALATDMYSSQLHSVLYMYKHMVSYVGLYLC